MYASRTSLPDSSAPEVNAFISEAVDPFFRGDPYIMSIFLKCVLLPDYYPILGLPFRKSLYHLS